LLLISQMSPEDLLTVIDAAKLLGISPWTMRHWISDGKIEFVKYGNGLVRLKRSTLDEFVASCTIRAKRPHGRSKNARLLVGSNLGPGDEPMAR
jgi:excisionase family DNA binding protein